MPRLARQSFHDVQRARLPRPLRRGAGNAGFEAVEFLFPYAFPKQEIAARLAGAGLQQVLFNTAQGDWEKGDRGYRWAARTGGRVPRGD